MRIQSTGTLVSSFALATALLTGGVVFAQQAPVTAASVVKKMTPAEATAKMLIVVDKNLGPKDKAGQIRALLKAGADANTNDGQALFTIAKSDSDNESAMALLEGGADPSLNSGAAVMQATIRGDLPLIKVMMKTGKIDPHLDNDRLLLLAGLRGHADVVEYFVKEHKLNPNGFDNSGKVMGQTAKSVYDNFYPADKARYAETLRRLKDLGADIHINDDAALRTVVEYGVVSGSEMMLDLGANINAMDGMTLRMALKAGRGALADMLLARGVNVDTYSIRQDIADIEKNPDQYTKAQLEIAAKIAPKLKALEAPAPASPAKPAP